MEEWVRVCDYALLEGISLTAVRKRIKNGNVSEDRVREVKRDKSLDSKRMVTEIKIIDTYLTEEGI